MKEKTQEQLKKTNIFGITGLVLSIISLCMNLFVILPLHITTVIYLIAYFIVPVSAIALSSWGFAKKDLFNNKNLTVVAYILSLLTIAINMLFLVLNFPVN